MKANVTGLRSHDAAFKVDYLEAESILRHRQFSIARRVYLQAVMDLYGEDAFLNKLLLDAARQVVLGGCLCLHAQQQKLAGTPPTLANLKRLLRPFGLGSDRRVEQVVSRLISVGYLRQERFAGDARLRLLVPTSAMLHHDQDWLLAHYRPLAVLYPGNDYDLPLARDLAFQMAQRQVAFEFIPRSAQVMMSNPPILLFAARDVGFLVLAQIALDEEDGVASSFDALASRFSVSRTHVRALIDDAVTMGLMRATGRGGRSVTLLPAMRQSLDRFVADGMSGHDLTGAVARRMLLAEG